MSVRSNSDVSVRCFFGYYSLCVMPDALAERFSHMSLPDLLILIRPGVNLLHLSRCLCVFSNVFLCGSHLFSLSFIHSDDALTNLPSNFGGGTAVMTDTPTFIRLVVFSKRWLIFLSASKTNIAHLWFDQESAPMGLQKFPMKGSRRLFF